MNSKEFFQSYTAKIILMGIAGLVVLLIGFSLGERTGFHKASFAFQNGNNFYQTFGPEHTNGLQPKDFADTHGSAGKVISITLPTITIEDHTGTEETIVVTAQTTVRHFRDTIASTDIKVGDYIVAIGEPNAQSQIVAGLIRELPSQ